MSRIIDNTDYMRLQVYNLPDEYVVRQTEKICFKIAKDSNPDLDDKNITFKIVLPLPKTSDAEPTDIENCFSSKLVISTNGRPNNSLLAAFFKKTSKMPDVSIIAEGKLNSDSLKLSSIEIIINSNNDISPIGAHALVRDLNNILDLVTTGKWPDNFNSSVKTRIGQMFFYDLYKNRYPQVIQEWIENYINNGKPEKALRFLEVDWEKKVLDLPSKEEANKILDETICGMQKVREKIISILEIVRRSGKLSFNILLSGHAGVGKTTVAQAISRVFNLPMSIIPMAVCQDAEAFSGFASTYTGATEGLFTGRVVEPKYYDANGNTRTVHQITSITFLNELDKSYSQGNNHGSVQSVLLRMLDDNREFYDVFHEVSIPLDNVMIIADCNDKSQIQKPLLDRFMVIDVDGYSTEEKQHIFKEFVFPKHLNKTCVSPSELSVSDDAVNLICKTSVTPGVRELKTAADDIIGNYLSNYNKPESLTVYSEPMVRELILHDFDKIVNMIETGKNPKTACTPETIEVGLKKYLALYKDRYPEKLQDWLEYSLSIGKTEEACKFMAVDWSRKELVLPSKEEARKILDDNLHGMKKAKDRIIALLEMIRRSGNLSHNILLNGPAGVGKTTLAQLIAIIFNLPMSIIPMSECIDANSFIGFNSTYKDAQEGSFTRRVLEPKYYDINGKTTNSAHQITQIAFLNELDKINSENSWHGSVQSVLLRVLDDNREFNDVYYGVSYPLDNVMIIADCNDKTKLQGPLLDRFFVIDIDGYTTEEKEHIFKYYVFPKALRKAFVTTEELSVTDEAVSFICQKSETSGIRELKDVANSIIGDFLVNHSGENKTIQYSVDMVQELVGNANNHYYFRV